MLRYVNAQKKITAITGNQMFQSKIIAVALSLISFSAQAALVASYGNNVYQYVNTSVEWSEAFTAAASSSWNGVTGHLVTITSQAENDFLWNTLVEPQQINSGTPWIALSDSETEGVWKWMAGPEAGQVAAYVNWFDGEPNDGGPGEDYAVMHYRGRGQWYDYYPSVFGGQAYIIEFENAVVPIPPAAWLFGSALGVIGLVRRKIGS